MYEIVEKRTLAQDIKLIGVRAPHITYNAKAGNFIVVIADEKGERIPLTIYDWDEEKSIVYMVFMEVGASTKKLGLMNEGDSLYAIAGPFGRPFCINNYGNVVIIGGGVGTPAIYPIARELKNNGNKITSITGYRTKDLVILENEMKSVSDEVLIATNDGSYGSKGLVTDVLQDMIDKREKIDLVIAVGPAVMMKAVSELTKKHNIKTIVSLNAIMIDATGMCGVCRVTVAGETKFTCVDGPDFDGHLVDFDQLMVRLSAYKDKEQEALKRYSIGSETNGGGNG
ncbi:MAG: sulfide/dihydroorotate dehydrogenase-like FAD/NAD-binding protein [Candidatus Goldbacteria bacterium]|nr:sulfide/dihydroorotate dehydrogenase-like FAD/NAD-binding protein [Candidatus Goldiibacteriota bacterium]